MHWLGGSSGAAASAAGPQSLHASSSRPPSRAATAAGLSSWPAAALPDASSVMCSAVAAQQHVHAAFTSCHIWLLMWLVTTELSKHALQKSHLFDCCTCALLRRGDDASGFA